MECRSDDDNPLPPIRCCLNDSLKLKRLAVEPSTDRFVSQPIGFFTEDQEFHGFRAFWSWR